MNQAPFQYRQKRTVVLASLQPTFEKNRNANTEMLSMATMLLARAISSNPEVIAIVHVDDKKGQETFQRLRQPAHKVNGEYKQVLTEVVNHLVRESIEELVVIGDEPDLAILCAMVAHNQGQVTIWSVDKTPSALIAPGFTNRHVSELPLEGTGGLGQTVTVWIDLENVLFPLRKLGVQVSAKELVQVLQKALEDLGNLVSITAYADFKILAREFGADFQYDLEEMGIKTRFQINHRGKNSADMALASDLQTSLELDPTIQIVVIVSGDRDLNPAIDAARQRGKKVVVVALEQSLSNQLRRNADEVRLLDSYFQTKPRRRNETSPNHPLLSKLLQMASRMQTNRWHWVYTSRLEDLLTTKDVDQLLSEGLLVPGRPGDSRSVAFNPENSLSSQIELAGSWIPTRVEYLICKKRMPWVDTGYIARGMELDEKCRQAGLGQNRDAAAAWLDAAAIAGLVVKRQIPHPKNKDKLLDTWRPPNEPDLKSDEALVQEADENLTKASEGQNGVAVLALDRNNDRRVVQSQAF